MMETSQQHAEALIKYSYHISRSTEKDKWFCSDCFPWLGNEARGTKALYDRI